MKLSQKRLKELIMECKKELVTLSTQIKNKSERASEVSIVLKESEKELQKICKHKNHISECKIVSRRMDYLDWDEPQIFYTCLDCGKEY